MAKQAGIHGLRGKVNGMSYYYSKNGGELTRKINEGIGERVKSSAAYVNTRKNNAEFGAAGASAGAIMRTIPQKYRYILKSTATGLLNKEIKKEMTMDARNVWGEREIPASGQNRLMAFFNTLSKNRVPDSIEAFLKVSLFNDSEAQKIFTRASLDADSILVEELKGIGATHVSIAFYALKADLPVFNSATGEYATPVSLIQPLTGMFVYNAELADGTEIIPEVVVDSSIYVQNDDPIEINGVFVVVLPQRKVGDGYNTLQEWCSAAWIPANSGTVPEP